MNALRQTVLARAASSIGISVDALGPLLQRSQSGDYNFSFRYLLPDAVHSVHMEEAKRLATDLNNNVQDLPGIRVVDALGPSVRFRIDDSVVMERKPLEGKNVIVEFSSPNIAKPFHAGHLRSTIIGAFLSRLHTALGANVTRVNYLGDWGKQYGLLNEGFGRFGSEELLKANPIKHLFEVYVKINKQATVDPVVHERARSQFVLLEQGEPTVTALWTRFRELSISEYARLYTRLGVAFDVYDSESAHAAACPKAIDELQRNGLLFTETNGALLAELGAHGRAVVCKADGASTYLLRDFAAAAHRKNTLGFDRMIYVAGLEQEQHFRQLFAMLGACGHTWASTLVHVGFGSVRGMSTRHGEVVFLEDILDEATNRMLELMQRNPERAASVEDPGAVAAGLGLAAVVVQDHRGRRTKDYTFEWGRMLQAEGDTGPLLQYTHARLCGIERVSGIKELELQPADVLDVSLLPEPAARSIAIELSRYQDALHQAHRALDPAYLLHLAHTIGVAHGALRVRGVDAPVAAQRALLFFTARQALASGLRLLGLVPLDRV